MIKVKPIRAEVLNNLCGVLQTLKDGNVFDYFTMNRRYIFSREEYENFKSNNEIKNSWYTIGPSYTDWGDIYGSPIHGEKLIDEYIERHLFETKGKVYYGSYMRGIHHYKYVIMIPVMGDKMLWDKTIGAEWCIGIS